MHFHFTELIDLLTGVGLLNFNHSTKRGELGINTNLHLNCL